MSESTVPGPTCVVDGCEEPAVVTPRAPSTDEVVDAPDGELVPLCADHAERSNDPEAHTMP